MKKIVIAICAVFALVAAGRALAAEDQHKGHMHGKAATEEPAAKKPVYKCPMHPDVTSDKPGKCPKCGMNLQLEDVNTGHGAKGLKIL